MDSMEEDAIPALDFKVSHQTLLLDVNFADRSIVGSTTIIIDPLTSDLKELPINFRQGRITRLQINGRAPSTKHDTWWKAKGPQFTSRQWDEVQDKVEKRTSRDPEPELILTLPKKPDRPPQKLKLKIRDDAYDVDSGARNGTISDSRSGEVLKFTQLELKIDFVIENLREGLQFVGVDETDLRYPHAFTTNNQLVAGKACALFPCIDSLWSRHTFELTVKFPKTLGDAVRIDKDSVIENDIKLNNGKKRKFSEFRMSASQSTRIRNLSSQDELLEMTVVGAGDFVSEDADAGNPHKKVSKFVSASPVSPLHIGFMIGPFQRLDITKFRDPADEDKLGQSAVPIAAYHLPGRAELVENTCLPLANILDYYTLTFGSYPFSEYRLCFVDDLADDTAEMLSASICSNRILYPENIIDFLNDTTRVLAHSLACQWIGIDIIPANWSDVWAVVGISYFMADLAMKKLCGNNEYRFWQKKQAGLVCQEDVDRPSLSNLGSWVLLDQKELDFMALKAPVVLFILDRRMAKSSGSSGLTRIISRIFLNAKAGDLPNGTLSTSYFARTCEKIGHLKLEVFFNQWVKNVGFPKFYVQQKFNKKKMVLEMAIKQEQAQIQAQAQASHQERPLNPDTFMRDFKEDEVGFVPNSVQPAFLGPMTIRIHEADGTPYEHIVELQGVTTKFDIPYNTKYKRLKRSRRQKERNNAVTAGEEAADSEESLLYCLGDVLQSDEEVAEWQLTDWEKEMETKMENESFEWIRLDADFEWICTIQCQMQPYMLVSQLQQDRDVVAQYEAIQSIRQIPPHPIMSTIFVRTVMDKRYFYGIRVAAAEALVLCATDLLQWIGLHHLEMAFKKLFGYSNDFSDRAAYYLQKTIPRIVANVRDGAKQPTKRAREFVLEKLKLNDNSSNPYSDAYYIKILIESLTSNLVAPFHDDEDLREDDILFLKAALDEIERYQRIDLWESSHHNIYTIAALRCKKHLMKAKKIPPRMEEFLPYTKSGSSEFLSVEAFKCMLEIFTVKNKALLPYFLQVLSTDRSPHVRQELFKILGQNLGYVATGMHKTKKPQTTGLTIEGDDSTLLQTRQEDLKRKTSMAGAIDALRLELETDDPLKPIPQTPADEPSEPLFSALWKAVQSPHINFLEQRDLLLICQMLYRPSRSAVVKLTYPRVPERVIHEGDGYIIIRLSDRFRTEPLQTRLQPPGAKKISLPTAYNLAIDPLPAPKKIKVQRTATPASIGSSAAVASPTAGGVTIKAEGSPAPSVGAASASSQGQKAKPLKLKFRLSGAGSGSPS
ncbi:MAG: hypothetical protein M1814_005882 [Vezdaea aestivalis]|nr:MAG: hypothetical protein M1814_005882 [Vezdaea aestivalis]